MLPIITIIVIIAGVYFLAKRGRKFAEDKLSEQAAYSKIEQENLLTKVVEDKTAEGILDKNNKLIADEIKDNIEMTERLEKQKLEKKAARDRLIAEKKLKLEIEKQNLIRQQEELRLHKLRESKTWFSNFYKNIQSKITPLNYEYNLIGESVFNKPTIAKDSKKIKFNFNVKNILERNSSIYSSLTTDEIDGFQKSNNRNLRKYLQNQIKILKSNNYNFPRLLPHVAFPLNQPKKPIATFDDEIISILKDKAVDEDQFNLFCSEIKELILLHQEKYSASLSRYLEIEKRIHNSLEDAIAEWNKEESEWNKERCLSIKNIEQVVEKISNNANIIDLTSAILNSSLYPNWLVRNFEVEYDSINNILIVEHEFPNIENLELTKIVVLKKESVSKPLTQKERKEVIAKFYPLLTLRLSLDLANQLKATQVKMIVVNGWVNYRNKATGKINRAFCSSLAATTDKLEGIDLTYADPEISFSSLKGNVSKTLEITPVAPVSRISKTDPRFIDDRDILANLDEGNNLAAMDWEDFEHLCRELFERVFAKDGAIVKVTQASRDQGVDAIIIDPRPIYGGRTVIQAKRYVNTVDVSAVRDLYGTVTHEGANKGILVTTSQFGPDSYTFIQGKNLELLNGAQLLFLLSENGYNFRIDLEEARRLQKEGDTLPFQRRVNSKGKPT